MCKECWREEWVEEAKRVAFHLKRAKNAGVSATLSLKAWFAILDFFGWRCAFCDGPFEAMDHFVPIELGGGTEQGNCLPICKSDNTRKSNGHPDDPAMEMLFSSERIERIRKYLSQRAVSGESS